MRRDHRRPQAGRVLALRSWPTAPFVKCKCSGGCIEGFTRNEPGRDAIHLSRSLCCSLDFSCARTVMPPAAGKKLTRSIAVKMDQRRLLHGLRLRAQLRRVRSHRQLFSMYREWLRRVVPQRALEGASRGGHPAQSAACRRAAVARPAPAAPGAPCARPRCRPASCCRCLERKRAVMACVATARGSARSPSRPWVELYMSAPCL